jgi:hypothetical protein
VSREQQLLRSTPWQKKESSRLGAAPTAHFLLLTAYCLLLLQVLLDLPLERGLGHRADHGVHVLPVLKEEDARD